MLTMTPNNLEANEQGMVTLGRLQVRAGLSVDRFSLKIKTSK